MTEQKINTENREQEMTQETVVSQQVQEDAYTIDDIEKSKMMAGLSYFLFFLPLIACPESRYAKFHANQSLVLLITAVVGNVILSMIPLIGWVLMPIFGLGILTLCIMGLINGFGGKAKELFLIGKFSILK